MTSDRSHGDNSLQSDRSHDCNGSFRPTLSVIIPTLGLPHFTRDVICDIARNTIAPDEILIVDNSRDYQTVELVARLKSEGDGVTQQAQSSQSSSHSRPLDHLRVVYTREFAPDGLGVNASWNYGIANTFGDYVAILNNDLRLCKFFFEDILAAFQAKERVRINTGIVVPRTIFNPAIVRHAIRYPLSLKKLAVREGWAFTIRRDLLEDIGPIPEGMTTFCGDDWLFEEVWARDFLAIKSLNTPIYHYVSQTVQSEGKLNDLCPDGECWGGVYQAIQDRKAKNRKENESTAGQ